MATRARQNTAPDTFTTTTVLWINRGLEALWLLTVVLVPLAFFRPENFLSEAIIGYVEVPKIALLRTLLGLMAVLWLMEWALQGKFPAMTSPGNWGQWRRPWLLFAQLYSWLKARPTRWVFLAAWTFLGITVLSTILSTSVSVSLWGEVPGQDGFSAYTIAAYVLLFGVIACHLKTRPQLWRLLGAIVLVGTLVSGYAVFQHYGYDFLGLLEFTGGAAGAQPRVTSLMGNAVFAGAAMLMPISISLVLSAITLGALSETAGTVKRWLRQTALVGALGSWVILLTIQLLGIIFTFSRGSWLGTMLALALFLALSAIVAGWRTSGWAALVLGLAGALTLAVLQNSGGAWLVVGLALAGVLAVAVLLTRRRNSRADSSPAGSAALESPASNTGLGNFANQPVLRWGTLLLGIATVVVLTGFALLPRLDNLANAQEGESPATGQRPTSAVQQRFASVTGEVISGSLSNRGAIWAGSWRLIKDRPWFDFDRDTLAWLRPVLGYGPDLYRYAYLLESRPQDSGQLPLEPDHAHNYFIHQTVEQGILGLLGAIGVFAALFLVGGYQLLRQTAGYSPTHTLLLVGLLATFAGRSLEQVAGLARVSDLTIFWALAAVFVALPVAMAAPETTEPESTPATRRGNRRSPRSSSQAYDWRRFVRLAIIAWAIGGIIAVTWVKTVNYPRAGMVAADSVGYFQSGNYQAAAAGLDRSSDLAPDVQVYHTFRASVYAAYLQQGVAIRDPECSLAADANTSYEVCLAHKIYLSNLEAVQQRPLYWRSRLSLANVALALGRHEEAIRLYQETVALVPASWPLHNRLAEAYIDTGQPREALVVLDRSLSITSDSANAQQALDLQKRANEMLAEAARTRPLP